MSRIEILDSTLRDGMQAQGISYTVEDKLRIVHALDNLGVQYIEAGNPFSNPKDLEFFVRAQKLQLRHSTLVAFGATRRRDTDVAQDAGCQTLLQAGTKAVSIVGKSSELQVTDVLRTTLDENLEMIRDTISFFKQHGRIVLFDAEHFFDGYFQNSDYAMQTLLCAQEAGADRIVLCDTNGNRFPQEIFDVCKKVAQTLSVGFGIHCHNDMGCAVANSMMAQEAGAVQIQGTYLGFGERCGNANLSTIIANLQLKCGLQCVPPENLQHLTKTARYIAEVSNIAVDSAMPYVGDTAFAHKAGMHVDGVSKNSASFEHVSPEAVGNHRKFLLSEIAGRSAVLSKLGGVDPSLTKDSPKVVELIGMLKDLEHQGYEFETAVASFELNVLKQLGRFQSFFELVHFKIIGENGSESKGDFSNAMVKIRVGDRCEITADEGDGPVHALDKALRKALSVFYPSIASVKLVDYKVRVIESQEGTAAKVRVFIESTDGSGKWTTVGVSTDIINASLKALMDSIEYKLCKDHQSV